METGEPRTYRAGPNRELRFYWNNGKAPCRTGFHCPKGSPEEAADYVLTPKASRILRAYFLGRGTNWEGVELDDVAREFFALLDGIFRDHDRESLGKTLGNVVGEFVAASLARPRT